MSSIPEYTPLVPFTWYTLLVFIIPWCSFIPAVIAVIYRRRYHPYLKARSVNILVLCVAGSCLCVISPTLFNLLGSKYPCWMTHIGSGFGPFLIFVPDIFRCVRLLLMDRIGKYKTEIAIQHLNQDKDPLDEKSKNRLLKRIQWMIFFTKSKSIFIIYGILFVFDVLVYFIFIASAPSERSSSGCFTSLNAIHVTIFVALYAFIEFILSLFLYRIREEFNIKFGIWITVSLSMLAIIGIILWLTVVPSKASHWFPRAGFFIVGAVLDVFNIAIVPLIRSYSKRFQTLEFDHFSEKHYEPLSKLKHVLENEESSAIFCEYCKREFSSENYYFWLEIHEFHQIKSVSKRFEAADYIMERYIRDDAALSLNISATIRQRLLNEWEQLRENHLRNNNNNLNNNNLNNNNNNNNNNKENDSLESIEIMGSDFFDGVLEETKRNMLDTFLRFRQTEEWIAYQQRLENERDAYRDLISESSFESSITNNNNNFNNNNNNNKILINNNFREKEKENIKEIEMN